MQDIRPAYYKLSCYLPSGRLANPESIHIEAISPLKTSAIAHMTPLSLTYKTIYPSPERYQVHLTNH